MDSIRAIDIIRVATITDNVFILPISLLSILSGSKDVCGNISPLCVVLKAYTGWVEGMCRKVNEIWAADLTLRENLIVIKLISLGPWAVFWFSFGGLYQPREELIGYTGTVHLLQK